jgi:hypothetical protein
MLLKSADGREPEIAEIERSISTAANPEQKARLERELRAIRAGIKGEQEVAYLIDFDLRSSRYTAAIHDLRLEINGRVAQVDHLLIHRTLNLFVLETKHFHAGIRITEEGEFLRWNDFRKTYEGMPSPLAQNERHIAVLKDAFKQIDMPTRMGFRLSPTFVSFVVVSPNARIDRPKRFDTSRIIKADTIKCAVEGKLDDEGVLESLAGMSKFVSPETLADIGRKLVALHRPAPPARRASSAASSVTGLDETTNEKAKPADRTALPLEVEAGPLKRPAQSRTQMVKPACRQCGGANLTILSGKYGYYFKCRTCSGNTPIKLDCGAGHRERLRKDASRFFRECAECRTSEVFFSNPD